MLSSTKINKEDKAIRFIDTSKQQQLKMKMGFAFYRFQILNATDENSQKFIMQLVSCLLSYPSHLVLYHELSIYLDNKLNFGATHKSSVSSRHKTSTCRFVSSRDLRKSVTFFLTVV
jgi:hypothetical protein